MKISFRELRLLLQLPLAILANRLNWSSFTKQEKDEIIGRLWIAISMVENLLLIKILERVYNWCIKNYDK